MPHLSSGFHSLRRRDVRGTELAGNLKVVKVTFTKSTKITSYNIPVSNHFTY
ncbi:unnamed protein product, partial [Staurois parvus]